MNWRLFNKILDYRNHKNQQMENLGAFDYNEEQSKKVAAMNMAALQTLTPQSTAANVKSLSQPSDAFAGETSIQDAFPLDPQSPQYAQQQLRRGRAAGIDTPTVLRLMGVKDPRKWQEDSDNAALLRMHGHRGIVDPNLEAASSESLLRNPDFFAILHKDTKRGRNLFSALTGLSYDEEVKRLGNESEARNKQDASMIDSLIRSASLKFDENGYPMMKIKGDSILPDRWLTVNNKDPELQLPWETAMPLLNPEAQRLAGIIRPEAQNSVARKILALRAQNMSEQQVQDFIKADAQQQGIAFDTNSLQPTVSHVVPIQPIASHQQPINPFAQRPASVEDTLAALATLQKKYNY